MSQWTGQVDQMRDTMLQNVSGETALLGNCLKVSVVGG
jgi:hypothetical protein